MKALADIEARSEDEQTELVEIEAKYTASEAELRAAQHLDQRDRDAADAGNGDTPEGVELREMRNRARVGRFVHSALTHRPLDGVEAEIRAAYGVSDGKFPLAMLAPTEARTATSIDTVVNQENMWLDRLFAESAAMYLGVQMLTVGEGVASFPVTTKGGAPAQVDKEATQAASAWTASVIEGKPKRASVVLEYALEDEARLGSAELEGALIRDAQMSMTEKVDAVVFSGDNSPGTAAQDIAGLNTAASVGETEIKQANLAKTSLLGVWAALVDGIHASSVMDMKAVISPAWYTSIVQAIPLDSADTTTLAEWLMRNGVSWQVRAGIAANTDANSFLAYLSRGRGLAGAAVCPIWDAGDLIVDRVSQASSGKVRITLNYLYDFQVVRASNFARFKAVA